MTYYLREKKGIKFKLVQMSNQHDCCRHFTTHALYIFEEKNVCENMTAWTLYTYNLRLHIKNNRFVFNTEIQIYEYEIIRKIDSHVSKFNVSANERICMLFAVCQISCLY